jgi:serine/threonine protein kinase
MLCANKWESCPQTSSFTFLATQASMALASVHNVDKEGRPSIAHTDISTGQFIKANGIYKLNDFNRARFIHYSRSTGKACPFYVGMNAGSNRSPEEYAYEGESEKVDVYSLGNLFFTILQGEWPFENEASDDARAKVMNGTRPAIYDDLWHSTDPVNVALKEAMILCHTHDPTERPTARYIENFFRHKMNEIDPGRLEEWGDA